MPVVDKLEIDTLPFAAQRVCLRNCFFIIIILSPHDLVTVAMFDEVVGFSFLRGLHLNDSKEGLDSKRDRHEHIGLCVPLASVPLSVLSMVWD